MKHVLRQTAAALFIVATAILPCPAVAQSTAGKDRIGSWYIGAGFGAFVGQDNLQPNAEDAGGALFFSAGYRVSPTVAIEADFLGWNQDFTTPASVSPGILSSADARTDLESGGLGRGDQVRSAAPGN